MEIRRDSLETALHTPSPPNVQPQRVKIAGKKVATPDY